MSKIINITDKLSKGKPQVQIEDRFYPVNNSMLTVMKFEELIVAPTSQSLVEAIKITLGESAAQELGVSDLSMTLEDYKVLTIAIMAAMQGLEYDEAAARFQKASQKG